MRTNASSLGDFPLRAHSIHRSALQRVHGPAMSRSFGRQLWSVPIVVLALASPGCRSRQTSERVGLADSLPGDSVYASRLARWLRDSVVLDSMTRLVNTDSLFRLYRRALEPGQVSLEVLQEESCEEERLYIEHGSVPAKRAIRAMRDTVFRDHGIRDGMRYFISRAPAEGVIEGGARRCGPYPPRAPDFIGATRLDTELGSRPRPSRRPHSH